jgi:hypothetical protein
MIKTKQIVFSMFIAACGVQIGCSTPGQKLDSAKENVDEANKDLEKANQEYMNDMNEYKKESATIIETNEASIKDFKARIATEKSDAKADYEKRIAELEFDSFL